MSAAKQFQANRSGVPLHRHWTAGVGPRACRITGKGSEHARLLRLLLLSHAPWSGKGSTVWPSNWTIGARAGLTERETERAMAVLVASGLIRTRVGKRGKTETVGRLIELDLHAPCIAHAPEAADIGALWAILSKDRARPAALVTAMVGAYMLASDAAARKIDDWTALECTASDWRRFIGQADNASWTKRLRELESIGLIRRDGSTVYVSPPRAWFTLAIEAKRKRTETRSDQVVDRVLPSGRAEPQAIADFVPIRPRTIAPAPVRLDEPARMLSVSEWEYDPSEWVECVDWGETG